MYRTEIFIFGHVTLEKKANSAFLAQKELISETVRARVKRMKFWDHPRKKNVFYRIFSCLVMWPLKNADSASLSQKELISETVRARAKRTKFWDHQQKYTYLTESFHFWSCDLEKMQVQPFLQKKRISWKWLALDDL